MLSWALGHVRWHAHKGKGAEDPGMASLGLGVVDALSAADRGRSRKMDGVRARW